MLLQVNLHNAWLQISSCILASTFVFGNTIKVGLQFPAALHYDVNPDWDPPPRPNSVLVNLLIEVLTPTSRQFVSMSTDCGEKHCQFAHHGAAHPQGSADTMHGRRWSLRASSSCCMGVGGV